eukprot:4466527-Pyramimonas_sp.AAC.1
MSSPGPRKTTRPPGDRSSTSSSMAKTELHGQSEPFTPFARPIGTLHSLCTANRNQGKNT